MPRWRLEYFIGSMAQLRSVEAEFDDLLGEQIAQAHQRVREDSGGAGTLRYAVLVGDESDTPDPDPVPGEPMITQWVTYVPYRPEDDPDAGPSEQSRREAIPMPARLFRTTVDAEGVAHQEGPPLGFLLRALRLHLADGREAAVIRVEPFEDPR